MEVQRSELINIIETCDCPACTHFRDWTQKAEQTVFKSSLFSNLVVVTVDCAEAFD